MSDHTTPPPNQNLLFEKYKFKVEVFKWAIGSVALVIVTAIIDWGFKDRAAGLQEIQQYDKYATELVILNDNPKSKRMLAQYFSNVIPSEKLRAGWKLYFAEVDREYKDFLMADSLAKTKALALKEKDSTELTLQEKQRLEQLERKIEENQRILSQPLVVPEAAVVPTVYIQFNREEQRGTATSLAAKINAMGFSAPGIDLEQYSLALSEIRYFRKTDQEAATTLQTFLRDQNIETATKYIPALSNRAKAGTIELWLQ